MKVKAKTILNIAGKTFNVGDIIKIKDEDFAHLQSIGYVEGISEKKEAKPKKQTKELKIDSKETKDETNKD